MLEQYPEELKYSESHGWVRLVEQGKQALVGITAYFNEVMGEVISVDLPEIKLDLDADEEIGSIDTLENSSYELYSPVSGKIIAINEELYDAPRLINSDPYGDGWLYKIELSEPEELEDLMSAEEYKDYTSNIE